MTPVRARGARAATGILGAFVAAGLLASVLGGDSRATAPAGWYTTGSRDGIATVNDTKTGLVWQTTADPGTYDWSGARDHCAALGAGWRMPTLKELQTIVDEGAADEMPASIDISAFPDAPTTSFWTSSLFAGSEGLGWLVSFDGGNTYTMDVTSSASVRCVQ